MMEMIRKKKNLKKPKIAKKMALTLLAKRPVIMTRFMKFALDGEALAIYPEVNSSLKLKCL